MRGHRGGLRARVGTCAAAVWLGLLPQLPVHAVHRQAAAPSAHEPRSTLLTGATYIGPVAPHTMLSLILTLHDPNAARKDKDLTAMYKPGSRSYGHYLSASEVASRYGPAPAAIDRLRSLLATLRLSIDWHRGNDWLAVSGEAGSIQKAFRATANWYVSPRGTRFYASAGEPTLPEVLQPYVTAVGPLTNYFEPQSHVVPAGGLAPDDLLGAYDIAPLRELGLDGTGQTVVFFESDGFAQSDLDTFTAKFGLPRIQPVIRAGPTLAAGAETEMDLEIVHEIAPGAKLLLYNIDSKAAATKAQTVPNFLQVLLDLQQQMVNDNPGAVLSQSWGICETPFGQAIADAHKNLYDHADALGESVFVSTGDNAAYECLRISPRGTVPSKDNLAVPLPAAVPGVTATGGTRLSVSANKGWYNETVWEEPISTNGTGGGVTRYFTRPAWQQGSGVEDAQYNPKRMRSIPDVSADGDPVSGASIYITDGHGGGQWSAGGGTSQSAPIWAGIAALFNQYLQQKGLHAAGFMNPALYQIAAHPSPYQAFHDVTMGSNLYYPATPGYDMASGLGTPDAWNLARDLEAYQRGSVQ